MHNRKRVCVVVFGDFGRSPRMQYHSQSLAANGFDVDVVAYKGSRTHEKLLNNDHISLYLMDNVPDFGKYLPRLLTFAFKAIWQSTVLLSVLLSLVKPSHILVQNPPSVPTLPVLWLYSYIRNINLVVDWHNYGFTILSLNLGEKHLLVKICRFLEGYFGSKASKHLCVTKALQKDLKEKWNVDAVVLYDTPPEIFNPISIENKHAIFQKLKSNYEVLGGDIPTSTRFTVEKEDLTIVEKEERPAIIISSTSWTEDEDFSLLIDALEIYDRKASNEERKLPAMVCVVTGKGPLKEHYENIIRNKHWEKVEFLLPWLEPEDYPKLLAACDLGVCLHTSSSGLDLPMKMVDMFGCGLPVCAVDYFCLGELLEPNFNGFAFTKSDELCHYLIELFEDFPKNKNKLREMRQNIVRKFANRRWDQNWLENAYFLFTN